MEAERFSGASKATIGRAIRAMYGLNSAIEGSTLEPELLELVKMRASQINGCAYCLDMHSQDALAHGETAQRLFLLDAWHEAQSFYTPRERAALAWTEAVTLVASSRVPDEVYEEAKAQFSDDELIALTMAVVAINGYNRLNVAFRTVPTYDPATFAQVAAELAAAS